MDSELWYFMEYSDAHQVPHFLKLWICWYTISLDSMEDFLLLSPFHLFAVWEKLSMFNKNNIALGVTLAT